MRKKAKNKSLRRRAAANMVLPIFKASENDRVLYEILIKEFPELKDKVLMHDDDGIGIVFTPQEGTMRWRNLKDVYSHYLPEINRRVDQRLYEQKLNDFINE